jgi:hypothetical protein
VKTSTWIWIVAFGMFAIGAQVGWWLCEQYLHHLAATGGLLAKPTKKEQELIDQEKEQRCLPKW